jgi:hypothetical protein
MKGVELYAQVRYAVQIEGVSRREAARRYGIDPRTVAKMLAFSVPPGYRRSRPPAASARIRPVLRRSSPSSPSRNRPADAATRSCLNKGRMRAFASRSDDAQSSSVSSIDAPLIHPLPTIREMSERLIKNATVVVGFTVSVEHVT